MSSTFTSPIYPLKENEYRTKRVKPTCALAESILIQEGLICPIGVLEAKAVELFQSFHPISPVFYDLKSLAKIIVSKAKKASAAQSAEESPIVARLGNEDEIAAQAESESPKAKNWGIRMEAYDIAYADAILSIGERRDSLNEKLSMADRKISQAKKDEEAASGSERARRHLALIVATKERLAVLEEIQMLNIEKAEADEYLAEVKGSKEYLGLKELHRMAVEEYVLGVRKYCSDNAE